MTVYKINGKVNYKNVKILSELLVPEIITQIKSSVFSKEIPFLELFDLSGGTGSFPEKVPELVEGKLVGYAGGMGPENVLLYLSKIKGQGGFWIDMETKVRTDGWFDLNKVEEVCRLVYES